MLYHGWIRVMLYCNEKEYTNYRLGFRFQGYDESSGDVLGWKKVENIDILAVEFASNTQNMVRSWNKRTQVYFVF